MTSLRWTLCTLAIAATAASTGCIRADRVASARPISRTAPAYPPVVLELVGESGVLPAYSHGDAVFVEGRHGEHYGLRVSNNSGEPVEAVVTVDGRDVVSGELGDFRKQRGYVIGPYSSVVIDGFRQSLDSVAAFRFAEREASYTARRGTPQHAGVVGVAVFRQKKERAQRRRRPVTSPPRPYYEPGGVAAEELGAAFPESERSPSGRGTRAGVAADDAFAPAPVAANEIGTAYGERRTSVVHPTRFRRHRKRRPDARLTVYYDSRAGLQARGVVPYEYVYPGADPQRFPGPYAPPPPPRWR